jgi:SAM-dependent methyltransferase
VSLENSTQVERRRHPLRRRILWKLADLFVRRAVIDEPTFDRKYGISTGGYIEQDELDDGRNRAHGVAYQATTSHSLRRLCETIDGDRSNMTFVDLGCGLGRALFAAYELGFGRMVGVEYSAMLYTSLKGNLETSVLSDAERARFEVHQGDASTFELPSGDCVVFLFNPFDDTILRKVVDKLVAPCAESPRTVRIVYYNAVHRAVFDVDPRFELTEAGTLLKGLSVWQNYPYAIYRVVSATEGQSGVGVTAGVLEEENLVAVDASA